MPPWPQLYSPQPLTRHPQLCDTGASQWWSSSIYQGSRSHCTGEESKVPSDVAGRALLNKSDALGTRAATCSSPVSAMTPGTQQVGTFSFLTCRGDNVAMLSTHRTPESLVSPLFLKTEFLASVDRQCSGAPGKWHATAPVMVLCGEHWYLHPHMGETEVQRGGEVLPVDVQVESGAVGI